MVVCGVWRSRLNAIEQVRVVTTLSELHQNVLQSHLLQLAGSIDNVDISHQDLRIQLALHLAQTNVHFEFFLGFELLLHF